ncbi:MAG: universal stress protein [Gemmatimonadetes bacterium]|nr:universal stress protein [Gemmatimonadota bacterium]
MELPRVLVGVDFSEASAQALIEARRLARRLEAEIVVVHVYDGGRRDWRLGPTQRAWLDAVSLDPAALVVRRGLPWVEIVREARQVDDGSVTLIVAGSHGASGFQPLALGSTATRLALHSPYPVLLISSRDHGRSRPQPDEWSYT